MNSEVKQDHEIEKRIKAAYYEGQRRATIRWAYSSTANWADSGVQYVGNCGRTLQYALSKIDKEEAEDEGGSGYGRQEQD